LSATGTMSAGRRAWLARVERWALPGVLLLAFALRLYRLGDQNIWWDEGYSVWAARMPLLDATALTAGDVHPPLYYWSLWLWVRLAGESEFAARFISAAWGLLAVAAAYALGSRLGGRRAGLLASLFLAVTRFHIWWSQEMRMHILAPLMATLVLYAAARWLDEARERPAARWAVLYTLAAAGCLYTLYLAALAPLAANLYAAVALLRLPQARRRRVAAGWLGAQAAALILFLPWLLFALGHIRGGSVSEPFSPRLLVTLYATLLTVGMSTDVERYIVYALPFAITLAGGLATLLWRRRRREPGLPGGQAALLLTLAVGAMPLAVWLMTRPRSLFYTPRVEARYFLLFVPTFCAFLGWSIVRLGRRLWPLGLAALAACLGVMLAFLPGYYEGRYLRDELQTMVRILGAYAEPGDALLLISGDRYPLFIYYYERDVPPERRLPVVQLPQTARFTPENTGPQLAAATAGHGRVWLAAVERAIQDPEGLSLPWLDQHYRRLLTHDVGRNALVLYGDEGARIEPRRADVAPQWPLAAQGAGVELLGYDLVVRECRAGDVVDLGLYHVAEAPAAVEVQWLGDDGTLLQVVEQAWPATAPAAGRAALRYTVAPGHPPGRTHFLLRWRAAGGESHSLRLPGPRILPVPPALSGEAAQALDIAFQQGIRLRGYDLQPRAAGPVVEVRPGEALTLDLFWEAGQPVAERYTVFTHLLGAAHNPRTAGPVWAQHDGEPGEGRYPTQAWLPGQVIADRHVLTVDPAAPPGEYELEVGLYLPSTLERLPLATGDDRAIIARVRVR
jgi:4-amino-4-deoxy-L-arabinose transferase-like glycosyltransferase